MFHPCVLFCTECNNDSCIGTRAYDMIIPLYNRGFRCQKAVRPDKFHDKQLKTVRWTVRIAQICVIV